MWRKGNPIGYTVVGMQTRAATVENRMEFPQKTKNGTFFDPAIPLLGIYPKNSQTLIQRKLCCSMFITVLFTMAKGQKQPKCPSVDE